ncbi:hypothetical protein O181_098076 [Austropuccinia psidii MF-1]|uniref:Integrase zinc-binding domain-containing protein n=1 Tax=Austropuccinia psidii MF-1 TaxID=1389203 RepID=A0A9Q3JAN6_9BASI|nr:hypothetical protein [Austropuccinia psidii MF-1]
MEIDTEKNVRFYEWAPESGTPDIEDTESEGKETPILGIGSSELKTEFFNAVIKKYSEHKQCSIMLQLLQQKYRSPELESQLEEPWENHTSALTMVERDNISLILQECHDCPYMGHMNEERTRERVASTAWWPKWEQ